MKLLMIIFSFLLVLCTTNLEAQHKNLRSVSEILNPDGTINLQVGKKGSFDPANFKMTIGNNGQPRFHPSGSTLKNNGNWDDRFILDGVDDRVNAVAVDANGDVYIGGFFTAINGDTSLAYIAMWDGSTWSPLGNGVNSSVHAIAINGNDVYAGGYFKIAGGTSVNYIARWDGSNWHPLDSGVNELVQSIVVNGSNVYAGGLFTSAGGISANYIARWDGSNWHSLSNGVNNAVTAIAVDGNNVYAGGYFTDAGNYIARWDGTDWNPLGIGVNSNVQDLAIDSNGHVYAVGWFTQAGGLNTNFIARWDGSNWNPLGSGTDVNGGILSIVIDDTSVYAGGTFYMAGGGYALAIARWDGNNWHPLDNGVNSNVVAIAVSDSVIYAGGWFTMASGVSSNYLSKWDGSSWEAVGQNSTGGKGINSGVFVVEVHGNDVYAGGFFNKAGDLPASKIVRWDGSSWNELGTGINIDWDIFAIAVSDSIVYAAGNFNNIGGVPMNRIAKWDGNNWSPLGDGVDEIICDLAINGNDLYVVGDFTTAGGMPANKIARWDGSGWHALGSGLDSTVYTIEVQGNDIYVGGRFTSAGGIPANHIARWDGNNWSEPAGGVNGDVNDIAVSGSDIYVGGIFNQAGSVSANNIAKWNGNNWSAMGSGAGYFVTAVAVSGDDVYAGGIFSSAGGTSANKIARWDGSKWNSLGLGINHNLRNGIWDPVESIAIAGNNVYVGGQFNQAGGKPSSRFAIYSIPEPAFQPTGLIFSNITITSLTVSFDAAADSPDRYLVVRKSGSSPTYTPVDGTNYSVGDTVGDGIVAYIGTGTAFTDTGLTIGTVYYYDIYSFNGSGPSSNFLTVSPLEGSQSTILSPPPAQPTDLQFSEVTSNSLKVSYTAAVGSPGGYLAVRRMNASPTFIPQAGSTYTIGQPVGNGWIAYVGSEVSFNDTSLSAGESYYYDIFSYNGSGPIINYLTDSPLEGYWFTFAEQPGAQPTDILFSNITTDSFTVSFTRAADSPDGYLAIRRSGSFSSFTPTDGLTYTTGDTTGDGIVAFVGSDTTFNDADLTIGTEYYYVIFAFNGNGLTRNYLTSVPLEGSQSTILSPPPAQPTDLQFSEVTSNSFKVSYTEAAGLPSGYIAIRRLNAPPTFIPLPGTTYSVGQTVGNGKVVYVGIDVEFNQTDLFAGNDYHYAIYAYNGNGPVINYLLTSPLEGYQYTLMTEPSTQPTNLEFTDITHISFRVKFDEAADEPDGYIAIRKEANSPTSFPVDGTSYDVGDPVNDGIVVFTGSSFSFLQTDLNSNTEYFYDIFSYNGGENIINYNINFPLEGNQTTYDYEPLYQPTNMKFSNITISSFRIEFDAAFGSPDGYIALRKYGSSPTSPPYDGTPYSVNDSIGDGEVAFVGDSTSWEETGLKQGEHFYDVFSYNGSGPAINYLVTNPLENSQSTIVTEPVAQPSKMMFSNITDSSFSVSFTEASGVPTGYIAIRKTDGSPNFVPEDGVSYTMGQSVSDGKVAYVGNSLLFNELDLNASTTYYYDIFAYNGSDILTNYLNTNPLEGGHSTLAQEPVSQPTSLTFIDKTVSSLTISFISASGLPDGYIALRNINSSPVSLPVDGRSYSRGELIGTDAVAYYGSSNTFIDSGLTDGTSYFYDIFSFNGNDTTINYLTHISPLEGNLSTLEVDVYGPNISNFDYPDTVRLSNSVPVFVDVSDISGINSVNLYYKISGEPVYSTVQMISQEGNTYSAEIPASIVTEKGVEFYIEAKDIYDNLSYSSTFYVKTLMQYGLTNTALQPAGNSVSDFRIFSVPIELNNQSPDAFIAANSKLGEYDQIQYRLFDVENGNWREYPAIADMTPGRGFFLISKISELYLKTGKGRSVNSVNPFIISLPGGWSIIGNPFYFEIPYDSLSVSAGTFELREYTGYNGWQPNTAGLVPWTGYAIRMSQAADFIIKPGVAGLTTLPKYYTTELNDDINWLIQIEAKDDYSIDNFNFVGQNENAIDQYDDLDLHEAPRIGKQISVIFNHDRSEEQMLTTDIRKPSTVGHKWNINCLTDPESDNFAISFQGIQTIPSDFDAFLIDIIPGTAYNLRDNSKLSFISRNVVQKELKLVLGTKEYLESLNLNVTLYPTKFELRQNFPNPFNNMSQIVIMIPEDSKIELKLYNMLGQSVKTLYKGEKRAGTHNILFNAKDLSSGIYIYQLKSGSFIENKKCIIIK